MLQQRKCRECESLFIGGPRAYYCPICRKERERERNKLHKRTGPKRPLGSRDKCERCGNEYIVESGMQRFCPECQPIHAKEYDRVTSIKFYHLNKSRINPVRYNRRLKGPKKCLWCGKEFKKGSRALTCSPECHRKRVNKLWVEWYHRTKRKGGDSNEKIRRISPGLE